MTTVKVIFTDGDYLITKINCSPEETTNYYKIGSCLNMGTITDELKTIKALEFIYCIKTDFYKSRHGDYKQAFKP